MEKLLQAIKNQIKRHKEELERYDGFIVTFSPRLIEAPILPEEFLVNISLILGALVST
jgi:hypothetical protein